MVIHKAMIEASREDAEMLALLFSEMLDPAPAVSIEEFGDSWLVELYFDGALPDAVALEAVGEAAGDANAFRSLEFEVLPDRNWVEITQRGLHPVQAGRFYVHGSHDRARACSRAYAIEIDAGQAFGTAHHGTTRGCLTMIDRLAKAGRYASVLDLGTGSGILAIAAVKSLTYKVLAADIDPLAVRVAAENVILNGVSGRVHTVCASRLDQPAIRERGPFPLIIANILAGPLIALAPGMRRAVADGGDIILSGLLDHQAQMVSASYIAHGFVKRGQLSIDGWSTLLLQYRG
ncbi:MAG TPA: 50S ribosomal protein L11 methyltransferase [Hyphomicrobiales bacterium]|nr:50S ribosomal protein L11 methyltransferase [Hyphomicrobiales bacterium]